MTPHILRADDNAYWSGTSWTPDRGAARAFGSFEEAQEYRRWMETDRDVVIVAVVGSGRAPLADVEPGSEEAMRKMGEVMP